MNSAEQYRALVNRLESIMLNEEEFPKLRIGDIDPRNGKKILDALVDGSGYVVRSRFGDIWNVKYGEPDPVKEPEKVPEKEPEKPPVKEPEKTPEKEPEKPEVNPVPAPAEPEVKPLPPLVEPPEEKPEVKCGPEVQAEIKRQKTFSAAFALARKSGCETFDWCQIVRVPGQAPTPKPQPVQGVTTNPMGDFDPTAFSGDFTGGTKREEIELEEAAFIPGSEELDRIREIAGTDVVEDTLADLNRKTGVVMGKPKNPETKCTACGTAYKDHVRPDGTGVFRHPFMYKPSEDKGSGQAQTPAPAPAKPAPAPSAAPGEIPEIKASSKEKAIEIARKRGIKVFRFCGKYGTQLAKKKKPQQAQTPVPSEKPRKQWSWAKGELGDAPGSDLPPSA